MEDAISKHPDADVLVSFASLRSAYESTVEALSYPQVHVYPTFDNTEFCCSPSSLYDL